MYIYIYIYIYIYETRHAPSSSCRANSARMRQSRPDSGLGLSHFPGIFLTPLKLFPAIEGVQPTRGVALQGYLVQKETPDPLGSP